MLEPVPMLGIEGKGLSLMISFEMNDNLVTEINFLPDTDFVDIKDENKKLKIKKSLQQQIASAQLRLNRLQHKSKQEAKQIETRQKIILGAEVAKAVDNNVFDVDKELVLGFLLHIRDLNDAEVIKYRKKGRAFLLEMKGRQI